MAAEGMIGRVGERQQALLRALLQHRDGLTMDELVDALGVTRTAVRQHLAALERDGYVARGATRKTSGRPGGTFVLTPAGAELFPKQYSWFSALLLEAIRRERGAEGLAAWLRDLAGPVSASLAPRLAGLSGEARLAAIAAIMNELGFAAAAEPGANSLAASNCVYHRLAERFPEVCQFDLGLLAGLTGAEPDHQACILRGGAVCRFAWPRP